MSRDSVTGLKRTMQSKSSIFKNLYIYTMKAQLSDMDMLNIKSWGLEHLLLDPGLGENSIARMSPRLLPEPMT